MPGPTPQLNNMMVRAGAGAGKTRGLVEKVVEVHSLFRQRGELPRIVLTTFTRKATQELKERLVLKACRDRDAGLLQFVSDPSRLFISTIHGLLNMFLRQVGHLAGLDAGFQLMNEGEALRMARLALRDVVVAEPKHLRWLETYGFARVLQMCRAFENAWRESGQLQPATSADLRQAAEIEVEKWRSTLAQFGERVVREVDTTPWQDFGRELKGFARNWSGDCSELTDLPSKPRRSKKQVDYEVWHQLSEDLIKDFKKEMGRPCWNRELWAAMEKSWTEFGELAEAFTAQLSRTKESQARYEMTDLELKAVEILREKPFLSSVFAEEWDFFMIDEYQDTSPLQVACLSALMGEKPRYFVGDPQQSIYLFRGAEVKVFNEAEEFVRGAGGDVRELLRNYRSQPDLLMWINDFMQSLSGAFVRMEPREQAQPERNCVTMMRASDGESELRAIASRIQELMRAGARLEQICVLGRTHRNLMEVSRLLKAYGYPTHVHSSRGFGERREVIDAQALWKFLVNPHDNLNLLVLLRSPWFFVADAQIEAWMADKPQSLWRRLCSYQEVPESIARLQAAVLRMNNISLVRAFEETLCAAAYLDLSLVNDPAGRKESNLWKLIHKARTVEKDGGASLLDFLDEGSGAEALDSNEGDATSAQEPNCINLMTIHGSKGLEFEHVILPRMGEGPRTSSTAPLNVADGRFFFPLWNDAEGEFTPSPLDYLSTRRQRTRELEEFDRWLYVALTRAKSTLTLTWSEPARESWAERSDWFTQPAGEYKSGHYRYVVVDEFSEPVPYVPETFRRASARPPWREVGTEADERHSVTELVDRRKNKFRSGGGENVLRRWRAQNLGSRVHRALEALKYGHPGELGFDEVTEYVLSLETPPMRELIANGHPEWGFQVQTASGVIEGQIDLWAKHDGKIVVVDYKSGSADYKDSAFAQLSLYGWALRKFGHQEPIEMAVIYPIDRAVEIRPFNEELFANWELEFSAPQTTR